MGVELPLVLTKIPYYGSFNGQMHGSMVYPALVAVAVLYATSRVAKLLRGLKTVNYMPGLRSPLGPFSLPALVLPEAGWWNPGYPFLWTGRKYLYKKFQSETFSFVSWISGEPLIISSNVDVMRQVAYGSLRTDFEKPAEMTQGLLFWGQNLVGADGDTWRRHRRVVGPAFNNKLYQQVWVKTADLYEDMLEAEGWKNKDVIEVESVQRLTFQLALLVISICGFGLPFNWYNPPASQDRSMTVRAALEIINKQSLALVFLPEWTRKIPINYFRRLGEAVFTMRKFMKEQVSQRKELIHSDSDDNQADAFTLMVKANEEDIKYALDESELIGNVFVMLFAGHETTAHTLAATVAFLAANPDIQQATLEHILSVVGWDRKPDFEDYNKLDKVLATFHESLRLFPAGHLMFRTATKDTVVHIPRPVGQEGTDALPVSEGTTVVIDMVGVQYNPRYFDDPEEYKPSRWDSNKLSSESEAFTAFSLGPRECIGRKFATTEAVSFLTLLIRDWKFEPLLRKGETLPQWKDRVLDAQLMMTLGVKDAPIRFVRRHKRV